MNHGKYDLKPSVENAGLTVRADRNEIARIATASETRRAAEVAAFEKRTDQTNSEAAAKYLARIADANNRDILTTTESGLPTVGPASSDGYSSISLAHNYAMVLLEQKIAELEAKIAKLQAANK